VTRGLVLGVGLSSSATAEEVRALVYAVLGEHELELSEIDSIATREQFARDERLQLGPRIVGYDDRVLEATSAPCSRTVGIRARVAETAALLAAASGGAGRLLAPARRSAHVTVAVATSSAGRPS
jgi:cobalamin biosynthesis protein CbiG